MAIKLLIFDLDGTLIDSAVDIAAALNYAAAPYNTGEVGRDETIELIGEGVTKLIDKLIARRQINATMPELLARFLDYYSAHMLDATKPYPGCAETLAALSDCTKIVISNKVERFSKAILEGLDLLRCFESVQGGDTVAEKKPSPVPILDALSRFHTPASGALLIGDSIYDIMAGKAAHVRTVAALYGYGSPDFAAKADFRIAAIGELLHVVREADAAP
jgi:phosphoglycolate phosphatase